MKLHRILGFYPKNIAVYKQAFTHKSILAGNNKKIVESNERLEFLGDTILDSVVSHFLFTKYPFKDEGYLTQLRSRFVSREMLNFLGRKIGLNEVIEKNQDENSASILGNALEALIGAIYIDKGYKTTQQFVLKRLIQPHVNLEEIAANETNFKSRVIEWCQKNKFDFEFVTINEASNNKIYTIHLVINNVVKGVGEALTKKKAAQLAAEEFYNKEIKI